MPIAEKAASPADTPGRRRRREAVAAGVFLLVLLASVFAIHECVWFMRAAIVMSRANPMPQGLRFYLKLRRAGVTIENFTIQADDHVIPVRVYSPLHEAHAPVIVMVHGFEALGNQDDYLNYLAERMALAGFQAVVPNITSEQYMESRVGGLRDIDQTAKWSSQRAHAPVSLFGVSFGGGLVLAAAEDAAYAPYVRMVFALSGYDSLERLGHYYIHDRVTGPDGHPYPSNPPIAGTVMVAFQDLKMLVPADQVRTMRKAMMPLLSPASEPQWDAAEAGLDPQQRQMLRQVVAATSPAMHARYLQLIQAHHAEDAEISPDGKYGELRCPFYELHGEGDLNIPVGEAEWRRSETPSTVDAHFLISPVMGHVAPLATATKWQKIKIGFFVADALEAAGDTAGPGASPGKRLLAWLKASR
jgi:dienelactone hydrolase